MNVTEHIDYDPSSDLAYRLVLKAINARWLPDVQAAGEFWRPDLDGPDITHRLKDDTWWVASYEPGSSFTQCCYPYYWREVEKTATGFVFTGRIWKHSGRGCLRELEHYLANDNRGASLRPWDPGTDPNWSDGDGTRAHYKDPDA